MSTQTNVDPLLTVQQLAVRESMKESQVRYLLAKKGLPHFKTNGVRIRYSEYLSWLESKRVL